MYLAILHETCCLHETDNKFWKWSAVTFKLIRILFKHFYTPLPPPPGSSGHICFIECQVDLRPKLQLGHQELFFLLMLASFHIHFYLNSFFVRSFVLFQSGCSNAQLFSRTLLHEFHIPYSQTVNCMILAFFCTVK